MIKFKIGDKIKRKYPNISWSNWEHICKNDFSPSQYPHGEFEIIDINYCNDIKLKYNTDDYSYSLLNFELSDSLPKVENTIKEDYENTKVKVFSKEESQQFQEFMLKRGFSWSYGHYGQQVKDYIISFPGHLYFKDKTISYTNTDSEEDFQKHTYREVTVQDILKGGSTEKMENNRIIYKVIVVDRRNSEIVAEENVAAQDKTTAILKVMKGNYNVKDVDHYHYDISTLTEFVAEKDETKKK